jgi:hypothetical protein
VSVLYTPAASGRTRTTRLGASLEIGGSGWSATGLVSGAEVRLGRRGDLPIMVTTDASAAAPARVSFEISGPELDRVMSPFSETRTQFYPEAPAFASAHLLIFPKGTNGRTFAEVVVRRVELRYRYRLLPP